MPLGLDEPLRERLARAIHDDHVARTMATPGTGAGREGLPPYEQLSEEARESYRGQTQDIAVKLEMIGAAMVPVAEAASGEFRFTQSQVERLSRHEHARWAREKRRAGWRFGSDEDPVARTHPCLVGYDRLPEEEKDKDRRVVERVPLLLQAVGLGIERRGVR